MKKEHFEILLEDMRSNFELVLEGHASLNAKMDGMRQEFEERFDRNDFEMKVMKEKIVSLDHKVTGLDQKVDDLDLKITNLDQKVDGLDCKVINLDKKVNGHDHKFDSLDRKLTDIADSLAGHRADTEAHAGYMVRERSDGNEQ